VTTPSDGTYTISNLPAGTYRLDVWALGYYPKSINVDLKAAETKTVDITLDPIFGGGGGGIPWWVWAAGAGVAVVGGVIIYKAVTSKPTVTVVTPLGEVKGKVSLE
jgi:hypothetical protein